MEITNEYSSMWQGRLAANSVFNSPAAVWLLRQQDQYCPCWHRPHWPSVIRTICWQAADIKDEVYKLLLKSPPKTCSLDPLPTNVLLEFVDILLPFICAMCNASLAEGVLPAAQKTAIIMPAVKKNRFGPRWTAELQTDLQLDVYLESHWANHGWTDVSEPLRVWPDATCSVSLPPSSLNRNGAVESHRWHHRRCWQWAGDFAGSTGYERCIWHCWPPDFTSPSSAVIVLQWLISFLTDRTQLVAFTGARSTLQSLLCGVPQGSVLVPLLFALLLILWEHTF